MPELALILIAALGILGVFGLVVIISEYGWLSGIRAFLAQARNRTPPAACECGHAEIMHSPIFGVCETLTAPFGAVCRCEQFQPGEESADA